MRDGYNPRVVDYLLQQLDKAKKLLVECNSDYNDPRFTDRRQTGSRLNEFLQSTSIETITVGSYCLHVKWDPAEYVRVTGIVDEIRVSVENIDKPGELCIAYRRNLRKLK